MVPVVVPVALLAHQIFRRYETYSILVHATILLGPPVLISRFSPIKPHETYGGFQELLTYLGFIVASVVIYRLSPFHPLARYPGPVLWRISMLFPALHCITGNRSRLMKALHDRYGDVVRTGPNELSIRDVSAIQPLVGVSGLPKGPDFVGGMLSDKNLPMVGIMDLDEHLRRRRAWNRGLGPGALKEYEGRVAGRAQQLIRRLEEQEGEVVLSNWINYFSYDFMCDMAFGGGSELLRDGDKGNVWHVLEQGMVLATFFAHVPWLGIYVSYIPGAATALNALLAKGREFAQARVNRGSTIPDLFHYLNNEDRPEYPPPPTRQLIDDGILAVVAGSDTTSSALTSFFFCTLAHPDVYARVQEEVDKFYPKGENVFDPKHHRDMHYLQATINETLRLFPPVAAAGLRKVPRNSAPVVIGNIYLPPETGFRLPAYTYHHDARNFSFPGAFWPERWLTASGALPLSDALARLPAAPVRGPPLSPPPAQEDFALAHNEIAFLPFSHGPMNCPGKGLAMLEMRTVACALMQRFRVRLRAGWDKARYEQGYKDYFSATRPELPVCLESSW